MIKEFVKSFDASREYLRDKYSNNHPEDYSEIVKDVVTILSKGSGHYKPDPEKITKIDHYDWDSVLLFIIPEKCHQSSNYWAVEVDYGCCSWCDKFKKIRDSSNGKPTDDQVNGYMNLSLHIVQNIHEISINKTAGLFKK